MTSNLKSALVYCMVLICTYSASNVYSDDVKTAGKNEQKQDQKKKEWGVPVKGVAASISVPKTKYQVGEPIIISYFMKNNSHQSVYHAYHFSGVFVDYQFDVRGIDFGFLGFSEALTKKIKKRKIPMTMFGKKEVNTYFGGSCKLDKTQSKETFTRKLSSIPLNRIFDMSIAGNYEVMVTRKIGIKGEEKQFRLISNTMKIKIVE